MTYETHPNFESQPPYRNKTEYFSALSLRLFPEMKQDIKFGKLSRKDSNGERLSTTNRGNWINVTEHCLVEAAAAEALGNALGLDQDDLKKLTIAAAVHDWEKRIEVEPGQFTPKEIAAAQEAYEKIGVSPELERATTAEYTEQFFVDKNITDLQKLLNYVDLMTDEADVVPYEDRLERAAPRAVHLTSDPKWTKVFGPILGSGKNYFDGIREIGRQEQEEIFNKLLERGYHLTSPADVPAFIKAQIEKNYMDNFHRIERPENSIEWKERFEQIAFESLHRASSVHDNLGETGEELVQKNQFGETALRVDIECEKAILDFLKQEGVPIRVISEEHGQVDITENPRYLGILDGLDGTNVYKKERGRARYGTMFGIFDTVNPNYQDYLASGIMEHSTKRLFVALKDGGAFVIEGEKRTPIHASGKTKLDPDMQTYIDEYWEINRTTFSSKLQSFKPESRDFSAKSSAVHYADLASGAVDMVLECTRKSNLEIAIAYGLVTEAGGVMVDLNGASIGDKKYLEFGQSEMVPIVTAATKELADRLLERIKT